MAGEQSPLEVRVALVLGRLGDLAAHDRRPPELDRRLGEAIVGNDPLRQPLNAVVGVGRRFAAEARNPHVAVPGVSLPVRIDGDRKPGEATVRILRMRLRPGHNLDVVDTVARYFDIDEDRALRPAPMEPQIVVASGGRVVSRFPAGPSPFTDRRFQVLELQAEEHAAAAIGHPQTIQIDLSLVLGAVVVERIREHHPQGLDAGRQSDRPGQRLAVAPGCGFNRQGWSDGFLVEAIQ